MKKTFFILYALAFWMGGIVIGNCQGDVTVERHIFQVADKLSADRIAQKGGRLIADYGGYKLYEGALSAVDLPSEKAEIRDQYNFILLNAEGIDTSKREAKAMRKKVGSFVGKRMHIVQFAGPIQAGWRKELLDAGVEIVSYIPQNAYLVYGDSSQIARIQALAAPSPHIRWDGAYLDEYKIHPAARVANAGDHFAIQLVHDAKANIETLKLIDTLRAGAIERLHGVLNYVDIVSHFPAASLAQIASRPDVISIQRYGTPKKVCERQDQIVAGNLLGNAPSGPGYLAWLQSKGFTQAQFDASGFLIDVTDSGIDNGTTSPDHFGLYAGGELNGESRVAYARLEGTASPGSSLKGCDGHGTLNAHLVCGYDHGAGFPFADAAGYHYGLGVCPFARVGSSVIFDPYDFTFPIYSDLTSRAYANGARISNDSWTDGDTDGIYNLDAQEFDALVRDAQPDGSAVAASGNQELTIVFAGGNDGDAPKTISPPGTAKNVITVGGAENVQKFGGANDGADLGGNTDSQADNANAMLQFSGRGPCDDGRQKPDLVAPAIHVSGGVIQAAKRGVDGIADSCFTEQSKFVIAVDGGSNGRFFFPANQQFYTASSGTSHSTPCVSGGCALLRQYFINNGWTPPSPAMSKAYLMNSARYMNGPGANDSLWSASQGMGEMNLGTAFDGALRILRDEVSADTFTDSGQSRVFSGVVVDPTKPFRVTLAWTDAPGSTTGAAYNNDLDLVVTIGGNTYKGNVFSGAFSTTGGAADSLNNLESVFLPAGVVGPFTVRINATSINSIGVPNAAGDLNQDFALVIYNAGPVIAVNPPSISFPPDGFSTNSPNWKITGAGSPGATVTIYDGANVAGTTKVNNIGAFKLTITLADGIHPLTASQSLNGNASAASAAVDVTALLKPSFILQPTNQLGFLQGGATFSSSAYGARPLTYYWEKNGRRIAGASSASLTLFHLTAASVATYQAFAANSYGTAASQPVTLTLTTNPFAGSTGVFNGLFGEATPTFESSGFMRLTLGRLGGFTAQALFAGEADSFSGVFAINGIAHNVVARGNGKTPLVVDLNLTLAEGSGEITGTISNSTWGGAANVQLNSGASNAMPDLFPGKFSACLQPASTNLTGIGFARGNITATGLISFNGMLSDNTTLTAIAAPISKLGTWPLYAALNGKQGSLWGWLKGKDGYLEGQVEWFHLPAVGEFYRDGFTNRLNFVESPFTPGSANKPLLTSSLYLMTLTGGGLVSPVESFASATNNGQIVFTGNPPLDMTLSVNPATGIVTGAFNDSALSARRIQIQGVVLQSIRDGGGAEGYFFTTNGPGSFTLMPTLPP